MFIIASCPECFEHKWAKYDLSEKVDNYKNHYICKKCGSIFAVEEMILLEVDNNEAHSSNN